MNIYEFLTDDGKCAYLSDKVQKMHYKIIQDCTNEYYHNLVERGWRRFGKLFLRPVCKDCDECQSLKIDVLNFNLSKSMRKTAKKNSDLKVVLKRPSVTKEHLDLFHKYHKFMQEKKGWDFEQHTHQHYFSSFVNGRNDFGYEMLLFLEDKLIAVDLIDILQNGISSVYFFYDPDLSKRYLGVYSIYKEIELAKELNLEWIYLGYYVKDCQSLNYKAKYKPYKILQGKPEVKDEAIWFNVTNSN